MRNGFYLWLALLAAAPGCAAPRPIVRLPDTQIMAPDKGVLFAVDGAGNFQECSRALRRAVDGEVHVETCEWSHGYWRVYADHTDAEHACRQGRALAQQILQFRQLHPDCPIFLVGHCSGSYVALQAAEHLPPDTLDRIVLLAPSVSTDYDLRPALRSSRDGVDVFWSHRDWFYLGVCVRVMGTADRKRVPAAGRVGFTPCIESEQDVDLYTKLRQHPWHPALAWTGHQGGHFDAYHKPFLRNFVLNMCRRGEGTLPKRGLPALFTAKKPSETSEDGSEPASDSPAN